MKSQPDKIIFREVPISPVSNVRRDNMVEMLLSSDREESRTFASYLSREGRSIELLLEYEARLRMVEAENTKLCKSLDIVRGITDDFVEGVERLKELIVTTRESL